MPPQNYDEVPILNAISIDLAESLLNIEIEDLVRNLVGETLNNELNRATSFEKPTYDKIYELASTFLIRQMATDILKEEKERIEKLEEQEIKKVAKEKLVANLMLDHMLDKMAQHGRSSAENEDVSKLLDGKKQIY
jgi:hypothetical protein